MGEAVMQGAAPATSLGVMLMTILVGLAVLCLLAYSLIARKERWDLEPGAGTLARLKKRRERLLRSIKDLELAREAGSLSEEELRELRNDLKLRAIAVTKDLERVRKARLRSVLKSRRGITPSQRKHVEDLVRERLARTSPQGELKGEEA